MRTFEAILATSGTDTQDEAFTPEALDQAARDINACYVPIGRAHDPRHPPHGRIVRAWVAPSSAGVLALHGEAQVWDDGDQMRPLASDARQLRAPDDINELFEIHYDLPLKADLGLPFLHELARLAGPQAKPKYEAKKAVEPLSALLVVVGTFTVGSIAGGFLKKIGEDLYGLLKAKLKEAMKPRRAAERLLVFRAVVVNGPSRVCVELVLANPSDADVEALFTAGLQKLDVAVAQTLRDHGDVVAEIVAALEGEGVRVLYWIRRDGVPSVIRPVSTEEVQRSGLSIGATVEDEEE